ncbi:MAG: efflux RND transporter periplasmic adaptor subunit [Alphaproteobacteria bacterium]|nr:efflux RND transporter periplasmic adaptor subunit [Alphaproteobacteria bacterium]
MAESPLRKRRNRYVYLLLVLPVTLVAAGVNEAIHWWHNVYEPNARVAADLALLSSRVNARIAAIRVRKGDIVEKGAALADMDDTVAALNLRALQAGLEKQKAQRGQVEAELALFKSELAGKIATVEVTVRLLRLELATLERRKQIAEDNLERNRRPGRNVVPQGRIDEARGVLLEVESRLRDVQTRIAINLGRAEELTDTAWREQLFRTRLAVIDRDIDKTAIEVEQAHRRLEEMHIRAPGRAVINEIHVNPGAYVEEGTPVFLIHDPDRVWIEADIDEADIRHIRPGQMVTVDFEAWPDETLEGRVRAVGHTTVGGSEQNGDGARRIPVYIDMPPVEATVRPGMRAADNIRIR